MTGEGAGVLRARCTPAKVGSQKTRALCARLSAAVMMEPAAHGLAAPQIGVTVRAFAMRCDDGRVVALVNPEITERSEETETGPEGCLSLPGLVVPVERSEYVGVRAWTPAGEELLLDAYGLEARIIQHEVDHLDGVLITDRAKTSAAE